MDVKQEIKQNIIYGEILKIISKQSPIASPDLLICVMQTVKFLNFRKLCCNQPKIQTKRPNLIVFCQKHANGIANSEDPDQTAP